MKNILVVLIVLFGISLITLDAEARRFGGGRSLGMQRNIQQPPKAPAQQQQAQPAAGTQTPATGNKWMGPLAGLALGAGLMSLFLNNGIAGVLAGLLLLAAIAGLVMAALRGLRERSGHSPLQYAGNQPGLDSPAATGAAAHSVAATAGHWPPEFDTAEFLRHARRNFVRLQEANDARDSAMLADVLTPDMLEEIRAQWQSEGQATGKTEVVTLESAVLDVVTEGLLYIVSVRFSGLIREDGGDPQPFAEIWHLEKPVRGNSGWMVTGIQQA